MKHLPCATGLSVSLLVGVALSTLIYPSKAAPAPQPPVAFDRIVLPTGHSPASIAVADLNHDRHPDLIVANFADGTLTVLFGDGKDHFAPVPGSPFACGPSPNDIAVADLNGDGNLDLIVATTETPNITVLLGDGRGGFALRLTRLLQPSRSRMSTAWWRRISSATASPRWSPIAGATTRSSCWRATAGAI